MNLASLSSSRFAAFIFALVSLTLLGGAGCAKSDSDQASDKMKDAYHDSKDAVADTWHNVKSYTFDKKDDFNSEAKARMAKIESQVSDLKKDHADAEASESRKAAWTELKDSQADYHRKVDALGNASSDTWDSAKANVVAAWDRLSTAYDKARAS